MIPVVLKAGSMGLKILRQLYGAKAKVGKATKKVADYAGKEGFTKTSKTISGVAKFLKEKNKKIKIWGIDTYGSVFKKFHETGIFDKNEIYPYSTEGIGEDIIPKNVDFSLIDFFEKVNDKDAAIYTRKLALDEGIFAGNSCGAAIKGLIQLKGNFTSKDVIVVLLHDSGSRYLAKIYNDEWMKSKKFI